jgi:hypothetical protein
VLEQGRQARENAGRGQGIGARFHHRWLPIRGALSGLPPPDEFALWAGPLGGVVRALPGLEGMPNRRLRQAAALAEGSSSFSAVHA